VGHHLADRDAHEEAIVRRVRWRACQASGVAGGCLADETPTKAGPRPRDDVGHSTCRSAAGLGLNSIGGVVSTGPAADRHVECPHVRRVSGRDTVNSAVAPADVSDGDRDFGPEAHQASPRAPLRRVPVRAEVHPRGVDEMLSRFLNDPRAPNPSESELPVEPLQIRFESLRRHTTPSTTACTARAKSRHSPRRVASARCPFFVS